MKVENQASYQATVLPESYRKLPHRMGGWIPDPHSTISTPQPPGGPTHGALYSLQVKQTALPLTDLLTSTQDKAVCPQNRTLILKVWSRDL